MPSTAISELPNLRNKINGLTEINAELSRKVTRLYCKLYGISALYHITRIENISSILKEGILSYNEIQKRGLNPASCSNRDIQEKNRKKFNDYVPLFFVPRTPFLCSVERDNPGKVMIYISIKKEIIGQPGICFSDGSLANTTVTKEYHDLEDLGRLDWNGIKSNDYDNDEIKRKRGAEFLVSTRIEPFWFEKLIVPSQKIKTAIETGIQPSIPIEIKPDFYFYPNDYR